MIAFSNSEIAALHKRIATIERERSTLETQLVKGLVAQKDEIRKARRDIQVKRLGARERDDTRLSKALYENILQESNLDSQLKRALEDFDRTNLVSIDFMQLKGQRLVQSISIGPRKVWALESSMNVAKK